MEGSSGIKENDGVAFSQCNLDHIECYNCGEMGHYVSQYPNPSKESSTNKKDKANMMMFTFLQGHTTLIHNKWILLDSQSTVDVFQNKCLLHNVRKVEKSMCI